MKYFILVFSIIISFKSYSQNQIKVEIPNLRSDKGSLYFSLFKSEAGFPNQAEKAFKKGKILNLKGLKQVYIFNEIPNGIYAISCFHDENNDEKLNTNKLGIPIEGTGNSGNSQTMGGPPKFMNCKFELKDKNMNINMNMIYFKFNEK